MKIEKVTRRQFAVAAGAVAALTIVPRHVLARSGQTPPNEKLSVAGIGVGGQGGADVDGVHAQGTADIVALCDVDWDYAGKIFRTTDGKAKYSSAKKFGDFRKMFDEMEKRIDAVVIGTPDHNHAVTAMAAIRRGKHVYCEKPLAHSVDEVRQLTKAAKEHNVVTQLGNQGHSFESIRLFCEWIWDGAIGEVHTIHCGSANLNSGVAQLAQLKQEHKVPAALDWDLWLGPTPPRAYHPAYHPGQWRGWVPFGNGTVGDWACHVVDPVFWALGLGSPATILAQVKDDGYDYKKQPDAFPTGEKITYEFPANAKRGPITMHWYSGTEKIPRPADMERGRTPVETGAVVLGSKGTIIYGSHGACSVRIIPEAKMKAYKLPPKTLSRVRDHHGDWLQAIRKGTKSGSDFSYGGPLTELALLGVIAIKMSGTKLQWDAANARFPNCAEADQFVNPPYRAGWRLEA
jgi:predicted dehydrogenase